MVGRSEAVKIIHVIIGLNVGGAELMLKRLLESHASLPEIDHSVISLTDLGVIGPQLSALGVPVTALGMRSFLDIPHVLYRLSKILRRAKPDIVQTWMYHADLLGGLAARMAGIKNIIWGVRTTDLASGGKKATILIRKICALVSKTLPKVIVCAAEASRKSHVAVGYDDKRMVVIPNGFDLSRLNATQEQREKIRSAAGIKPEELVIGSLGRFNPVKDHLNFIAATALLAEKFPDLKFLLVGRGLEHANAPLMQIISATGYVERFALLGERQDVAACLKAMDIFCLHSKTEGFPNVLGEAMAMGLPCVSTDVGDAAYLLNGSGIVVLPQDSQALASGLQEMVNLCAEERSALARSAKSRIYSNFSIARASESFIRLYKQIASGCVLEEF
jgi:glycosyltransferase involved in cell wall biosynthesis